MKLADTDANTALDDWWGQVADAYADETPFSGEFNNGEGTFTPTSDTTEGGNNP